jgi:hypothetical protein
MLRIATPSASVIALVVCLSRAEAQSLSTTFAVGAAVPTGRYALFRSPGPLVRAGLTVGAPERHVWLRVEGEGAWLVDQAGDRASLGSQRGTLRALGVLVTLAAGPHLGRVTPYVLLGAGPQWLRVEGATNPYGASLGARAGAGVRVRAGRVELEAELAAHGVASDFGTGRDFAAGSYVPLTLGVRF